MRPASRLPLSLASYYRPGLPARRIARPCSTAAAADTARKYWAPILHLGDDDTTRSKFGGKPFVPATMSWPTCKVSGDPLLFLCQIEARTSPLAACMEPDLMLQFFARAQGRAVGGDGGVLARLVRAPDQQSEPANMGIPASVTLLESAVVTGWEEGSDYPGCEEPDFPLDKADEHDGGKEAYVDRFAPAGGLKIGGWPYWVRRPRFCTGLQLWPTLSPLDSLVSKSDFGAAACDLRRSRAGTCHAAICAPRRCTP